MSDVVSSASGQSVPASQTRSTSRPCLSASNASSDNPLRVLRRGIGLPPICTDGGPNRRISSMVVISPNSPDSNAFPAGIRTLGLTPIRDNTLEPDHAASYRRDQPSKQGELK